MDEYLLGERFPRPRSPFSSILRQLSIEDHTHYRASSSGSIVATELFPSNNVQKECSIMAKTAEVTGQMMG